ncbi:MAG: DUF1565 domain-containing protein [Chloroflexi bacterium]|nr:MAG: DUF1565 domain-containing protein [Chloroflexota bacterium]MBL1195089.1 DUF1565 domain-containing protein [Chloroflexota bacterium]NOH12376.1 DUF1565 domain-containing protein [Chloroflexota bacterium]
MNRASRRIIGLYAIVFLLAACAPAVGPFSDYYVSTTGRDHATCGPETSPCRTIQYALDTADYSGDDVHIRVAAGEYPENLTISRSVKITGAGIADSFVDPATTRIVPPVRTPGAAAHEISDAHVELRDIMFNHGLVQQISGTLYAENVSFFWVQGLYGLELRDVSAFNIVDCDFKTPVGGGADNGLRIWDSIGEVTGGYWGDGFDHAISISRRPSGSPTIVEIDDVTIRGASIWYADGIRVFGSAQVDITNSEILRVHDDAEAWRGSGSDGVAAGIGYQRIEEGNTSITNLISGNIISGFDVGISLDSGGVKFLGEENNVAGDAYVMRTWADSSGVIRTDLVVDFGGGPLGSTGGNTFHNTGDYAVYHEESYPIYACFNDWEVPEDQIDPRRVWDELDHPRLGRTHHLCVGTSLEDSELTLVTVTPTPDGPSTVTITTTTPCYNGPGPEYGQINTLKVGVSAQLIGAGFTGNGNQDWVVTHHPTAANTNCWLDTDDVTPSIPFSEMRLITVPGLPTPTPKPTSDRPPQESTPACYYDANNALICP